MKHPVILLPITLLWLISLSSPLLAQSAIHKAQEQARSYYFPLNGNMPPGQLARWASMSGRAVPVKPQPVLLQLPSSGAVSIYRTGAQDAVTIKSTELFQVFVGHTYRLKVAELPEYPGVELYPSIEVLDRLNPPAQLKDMYPIPIEITDDEIDLVLSGRMITKVIFLEQPQLADVREQAMLLPAVDVPTTRNLMTEADLRGRPLIVIRLGGRLPDPHNPDPKFFGTGAPVLIESDTKPEIPTKPQIPAQTFNQLREPLR